MKIVDPNCPVNWGHPLTRGLVGWWQVVPSDGWRGNTWRDLVRGGKKPNDGTLTNGPTWKGNTHRGGFGSLAFDGSNDYVDIGTVVTGAPCTLLCMWYTTNASAYQAPITFANSGSDEDYFGFEYDQVAGNMQAVVRSSSHGRFVAVSTLAIAANTWYFLAAVFSTTTSRTIYVNSANSATDTNLCVPSGINNGSIGRLGRTTHVNYVVGNINNALVFNRTLTQSEIAAWQGDILTGSQRMLNWVEAGWGSVEEAASPVARIFLPSLLAVA